LHLDLHQQHLYLDLLLTENTRMPIELRFDDLDLREEPESGKSPDMDSTAGCDSTLCTRTCTGSYNTCTTFLC
jgi:hypothetical protein